MLTNNTPFESLHFQLLIDVELVFLCLFLDLLLSFKRGITHRDGHFFWQNECGTWLPSASTGHLPRPKFGISMVFFSLFKTSIF